MVSCGRLGLGLFGPGRCVGLGSGVLWCVPVIYGEAGEVM